MKPWILNLDLEVSHKSLYGHMRNHPERNWTGAKPPIPETNKPASDSVALERYHSAHHNNIDSHLRSNLFLPRWSKTGRRTRPGKSLSDNEAYDQLSSLERENLPPKKRNLESSVPSNPAPESSKKNSLVINDKIPCKIPVRARKQHACDICARSFKSYQALGGHKAHHNKKCDKIAKSKGENDEFSTPGFVHECPFCKKRFSKGQALGGHKRHCGRPGGEVGKNKTRALNFDLNKLPPEWIEEEETVDNVKIMKF